MPASGLLISCATPGDPSHGGERFPSRGVLGRRRSDVTPSTSAWLTLPSPFTMGESEARAATDRLASSSSVRAAPGRPSVPRPRHPRSGAPARSSPPAGSSHSRRPRIGEHHAGGIRSRRGWPRGPRPAVDRTCMVGALEAGRNRRSLAPTLVGAQPLGHVGAVPITRCGCPVGDHSTTARGRSSVPLPPCPGCGSAPQLDVRRRGLRQRLHHQRLIGGVDQPGPWSDLPFIASGQPRWRRAWHSPRRTWLPFRFRRWRSRAPA
jgi:hypothetical protein